MPLIGEPSNPLDIVMSLPQYQQADSTGRLKILSEYEEELRFAADELEEGGWEGYKARNPEYISQLESNQRSIWSNEMKLLERNRSRWVSDWYDKWEGEGGPMKAFFNLLPAGILQSVGYGAKILGYDETAEQFFKDAQYIPAGWDALADEFNRKASELDEEYKVTNEFAAFMSAIFPSFETHDRQLLQQIMKQEGITDEMGLLRKSVESYNISKMLGHFTRIKITMDTVGKMFPKSFGQKAAAGTLAARAGYASKYAVAAGINSALDVPVAEQTLGNIAGTMAGTYAAMLTGTTLSAYALKNPVIMKVMARLPAVAQEFFAGRIADVGESIANSVEQAIRTRDPWEAIKAFPAALISNFIEEILIDLPGIPHGMSRTGRWQLKQAQIAQINKIESGLEERIEATTKVEDKAKLHEALKKLQTYKEKRVDQFKDLISKEAKRKDSLFNANKEEILAVANSLIAEGVDKDAAYEEAVAQVYLQRGEVQQIVTEATEDIDKQMAKQAGKLKQLGRGFVGLFGRETRGQIEQRAEAERIAVTQLAGEEAVTRIDEEITEEAIEERFVVTEEAREERVAEEVKREKLVKEVKAEKIKAKEVSKAKKAEVRVAAKQKRIEQKKQLQDLGYTLKDIKILKQKEKDQIIERQVEKPTRAKEEKPKAQLPGLVNVTEAGKRAIKANTNPDKSLTVYHGTTQEAFKAIKTAGITGGAKYGGGVTTNLNNAVRFASQKEGTPIVIRLKIPQSEVAKLKKNISDISFGHEEGKFKPEWIVDTALTRGIDAKGWAVGLSEGQAQRAEPPEPKRVRHEVIPPELVKAPKFEPKAKTGIDIKALEVADNYIKRFPRLANFLTFQENGSIEVDLKAFEEEYGRKFKGEDIMGRTVVFYDGRALIELSADATQATMHHEWFHLITDSFLNDDERKFVYDRYDTIHDAAEAFAVWATKEESRTAIGKVFAKIKKWFTGMWKSLTDAGYKTVDDVFSDIYFNPGTFIDYDALNRRGFLTEVEFVPALEYDDYPEAYKNNWVARDLIPNGITYSVRTMSSGNRTRIKKDLDVRERKYHRDHNVLLEDKDNFYAFNTDEYHFNKGDLNKTLKDGLIRPKPVAMRNRYAIKDLPDPVAEGAKASDIKGIFKLPKDVFNFFSEMAKRTKERARGTYKKGDPINSFEAYVSLPAHLKKKSKALREGIELEYRRERERKVMIRVFTRALTDYNNLQSADMLAANELLVKGDRLKRDLTEKDMDGYTEPAKAGYRAVRKSMDLVGKYEITYLEKKANELEAQVKAGEFEAPGLIGRVNNKVKQLRESADRWRENIETGYIPHIWDQDAHWEIVFAMSGKKDDKTYLTPEKYQQFSETLNQLKGGRTAWTDFSREDYDKSQRATYRLHYKKTDDFTHDRDLLEKLGIEVHAKPYDTDKAQFDLDITRVKLNNMFAKITDKAREGGKKRGQDEAVMQALDILEKNANIYEMAAGWRAQELKREGTYGYEIDNIAEVIHQYITGYAGIYTKRELSQKLFYKYSQIPSANKNERKVFEHFMSSVLHNNNKTDRLQGQAVGWLFHKYIAFNIPFHVRNRWQPWYLGVPVLSKRLGAKKLPAIGAAMISAQATVRNLEFWLIRKDVTLDREADLIGHLKGLRPGEVEDLYFALSSGLLDEQLPEEWKDLRAKQFQETTLSKMMGYISGALNRWVVMSDAKNRLQVFLAGRRLGLSQEEALETSREANVVYKKWNVPGFFATEFGRKVKFAFPFQKYQWHTVEWMFRNGLKGLLGPTLFYWLISQLLGGKDANPFWRGIKKATGIPAAAKARERMVKAIGGNGVLLDLWDQGLISTLIGTDMSGSFSIRPFSIFDPLLGNIWASEIKGVGRTFDSLRRGRWMKAVGEDFPLMPRYASKVVRAYRQATEGLTTYKGDTILDINGKPFTLKALDVTKLALGFMPSRLAKHYKATRDVRALREYFSDEKSRIGTRFKIATKTGDRSELAEARKDVEEFNAKLREYAIGGTLAVNEINKITLRHWRTGADTKRIREIIRSLYVF